MPNIPYGGEGVPSGVDTQEYSYVELLAGSAPAFASRKRTASGAAAIAAFTVVKVVAGLIVPAAFGDVADGITLAPIIASGDPQNVGVAVQGNFNIGALVFDATFDTDAKKLAAFDGAASPTSIILQKIA
jgi:hypothetical protein